MAVITLTKDNFATEVEQAQGPVLVDFWATWCGPCRMIGPVVEQIAEANAGKLKVGKVNVDEQPELAARFGVMSIPTLILFKGGQQVEQVIGANPGALGAMVQNNI
ncbi:thioredoxin [Luoshenia tenuis]|jgi:thioredoxin 1|uniref:thioredoxin n=1 Tax=Luoshenia tenuis TaxID=2763654 RepID=UPI003D8C1226